MTYKKGIPVEVSCFLSTDMDCKCDNKNCNTTLIEDDLLIALSQLHLSIGEFYISSGFRCPAHNAVVGGKPDSQHLLGKAADIKSSMTPKAVATAAAKIDLFENGGIGLYATFTHCDVRKGRARWGEQF